MNLPATNCHFESDGVLPIKEYGSNLAKNQTMVDIWIVIVYLHDHL